MAQLIMNNVDIFHKILPAKYKKYDVIWIEGNLLCAYNSAKMFSSGYNEIFKDKHPTLLVDYRNALFELEEKQPDVW